VPSTHVFSGSLFSFGINHYLKSGTAAFQISADEGAAESWYKQNFAACGYIVQATEGHTARGVGIEFYSTIDRHAGAWIVLEPDASGGTFVLYVGEVIVLPPRPRDSYLPGDSVQVQLRYIPPTTPEPPYPVERFTILRRVIVDQLVTEINALTDVAGGGVMGCTWSGTTTLAWLRFVRPGGRVVTVRVQPGCELVIVAHARPLIDLSVWDSIQQIVAECREKRS
jgi:hypothetical protein